MRYLPMLVLLGGCWPYIPGGFGGKPAETTVVIGEINYLRYLGAYWTDGSPQLAGWVATFDPPQNVFMIEYYGQPGTCQHNAPYPAWWGQYAANGSGAASIASDSVALGVQWDGVSRFAGSAAGTGVEPGSWWSVSGVNSGPYGAYVVDNAVYMPSDLTLTAPIVNGAAMGTQAFADIPVQWSGANDADEIAITLQLMDSTGAAIELLECRVPNSGSFLLPVTATMTQWASSTQAIFAISALHQQDAKVDFSETGGTRMLGSNTFVGAFVTQ
ncbi:MAG: hypothetical protein EP330_23045 [Deltaproteobacteria bacterium]|nr:MAG: hypothetical protein EP330_23045 [Deltaproteobacteria bacterium]